jgi:hypothetical protein
LAAKAGGAVSVAGRTLAKVGGASFGAVANVRGTASVARRAFVKLEKLF